jgi:hypothetical protein
MVFMQPRVHVIRAWSQYAFSSGVPLHSRRQPSRQVSHRALAELSSDAVDPIASGSLEPGASALHAGSRPSANQAEIANARIIMVLSRGQARGRQVGSHAARCGRNAAAGAR